jgi:membrane associated rhomboid family serine protease
MLGYSPSSAHTIREEFRGILIFVAVVWMVFIADALIPLFNLNKIGLTPRSLTGLTGIATMPFLHKGWGHLISNSVPLVVLLTLLAGSRARTSQIVTSIIVLSGGLLWIFGRDGIHIGASCLVFGLITFLVVSGLLEKRLVPLLISILVGVMYGWTFVKGILPFEKGISWDGHLLGGVAGALVAFVMANGLLEEKDTDMETPAV